MSQGAHGPHATRPHRVSDRSSFDRKKMARDTGNAPRHPATEARQQAICLQHTDDTLRHPATPLDASATPRDSRDTPATSRNEAATRPRRAPTGPRHARNEPRRSRDAAATSRDRAATSRDRAATEPRRAATEPRQSRDTAATSRDELRQHATEPGRRGEVLALRHPCPSQSTVVCSASSKWAGMAQPASHVIWSHLGTRLQVGVMAQPVAAVLCSL